MGISRLTVMMIQGNDVGYIDTPQRSEAWMMREGHPHALLLSCPLDKRPEMEKVIAELKAAVQSDTSKEGNTNG